MVGQKKVIIHDWETVAYTHIHLIGKNFLAMQQIRKVHRKQHVIAGIPYFHRPLETLTLAYSMVLFSALKGGLIDILHVYSGLVIENLFHHYYSLSH